MTTPSLSITSSALAAGLLSLVALSGAPALANESDYPPTAAQTMQSSKTRDEVRMEFFQARKEGRLPQVSEVSDPAPQKSAAAPAGGLSREAVKAETIEWLRTHRSYETGAGAY